MTLVLSSRAIGWLSLMLLGLVIALPYLRPRSGNIRLSHRRMSFHYWLAPLVVVASFIHAWIPMASRHMPRTNFSGFWIATVALGLVLLQLLMGLALRSAGQGAAIVLRRMHFAMMLGIAALVLIHLWMNGPFIRSAG